MTRPARLRPIPGQSDQRFDTFGEWVARARYVLTSHPDFRDAAKEGYGSDFRAICFDTKGRLCRIGADFMRARDEGAFPVYWVWPDQVPELAIAKAEGSEQ